ncbi:helix-turn-helix domain-containing protein [Dyadobacter sp. CY261]|uniref:AraC family transcriptional regulator n=1 Tax=Dyadobacter sp. CY261 TaxID=2907203 RepID=UPI001F303072|nr:helix-turn-helix domain-containing protein [Dyadobacter sp. CY261]MCF0074403.1 helix-turn-helix domain-containing protein [Dyadobacter sp. CY261]
MKYHQILPPPHLRDYVRYYWALESTGQPDEQVHFVTIADGSPGIIFQQSVSTSFQEDKELAPIFLYGQATAHTRIISPARFSTIGAYFYPHALKSIFGMDANELTNDCLDLDLFLNGKRLMERLENAVDVETKAEIISDCLWEQISRNDHRLQAATRYALQRIIQSQGGVSMKDLRQELQVSERTLERRFQEGIGLSPMLFARICRFQASLNQLRSQSYDKLSDIAFEQEYADQSHFIRNFKEFTGLTPFQFRKSTRETVENFPVLVYS